MSIFDDKNQVKSAWIKWGKVGDYVAGTLVNVREMESRLPGKEGERVKVYEIKVDEGIYHELDEKKNPVEPAQKIVKDEYILVGGKAGLDEQMRRIKLGQKLGVKFISEAPAKTKGFNALKIIKVFTEGKLDEEWLSTYEPTAGDVA